MIRKKIVRTTIILASVFSFSVTTFAEQRRGFTDPFERHIAEYFYSRTGNEILGPVRILGGVDLPGVYHIPKNTDLATLISISGGIDVNSDIHKIKYTKKGEKTVQLDLYDHIEQGKEIFLNNGDTVFIPNKVGWISNETATTLTVIVSILTLGLTAYVVSTRDR